MSDHPRWLVSFANESNKIEGMGKATAKELAALEAFLETEPLTVGALIAYVSEVAPGHRLRDIAGLNVRVGNHIAPPGGPERRIELDSILTNLWSFSPFENHLAYETLHPFTDGNGRSGRALWLWQQLRFSGPAADHAKALGFLHSFYYETLSRSRP